MQIQLITNNTQFKLLKNSWHNLQTNGAVKNITTSWEWMSTWWDVFHEDRELAILTFTKNEEVIGIAPFVKRKTRLLGFLPYVKLEFMASGEEEQDEICTDYLDIIVKKGYEQIVTESLFNYLIISNKIKWDELLLPRMDSESIIPSLKDQLARKYRIHIEKIKTSTCCYAKLPTSYENFLLQLGKKTRYKINRGIRKLGDENELSFKISKTSEEIKLAKESLIQLHQSRWNTKGKQGVFSSKKFRLFHDIFIEKTLNKNWIQVGTLYLGETPVACIYNFNFLGKIHSYQSGVTISDSWDISYGMIAHTFAIKEAITQGNIEYDFLAGVSGYKERLAKNRREIISFRISKPSLYETIRKTLLLLKKATINFVQFAKQLITMNSKRKS